MFFAPTSEKVVATTGGLFEKLGTFSIMLEVDLDSSPASKMEGGAEITPNFFFKSRAKLVFRFSKAKSSGVMLCCEPKRILLTFRGHLFLKALLVLCRHIAVHFCGIKDPHYLRGSIIN